MSNDPNKSNALRNTLLGFVTSVILILVGYWLNNCLSRDNLSIEYVRFVPETEGPLPSPEMRHKLHELSVNPHFQRLGTSDPFSPTCQLNPSNNGEEHPDFAKGVTKYLKGCVVTFQDSIRQDLD